MARLDINADYTTVTLRLVELDSSWCDGVDGGRSVTYILDAFPDKPVTTDIESNSVVGGLVTIGSLLSDTEYKVRAVIRFLKDGTTLTLESTFRTKAYDVTSPVILGMSASPAYFSFDSGETFVFDGTYRIKWTGKNLVGAIITIECFHKESEKYIPNFIELVGEADSGHIYIDESEFFQLGEYGIYEAVMTATSAVDGSKKDSANVVFYVFPGTLGTPDIRLERFIKSGFFIRWEHIPYADYYKVRAVGRDEFGTPIETEIKTYAPNHTFSGFLAGSVVNISVFAVNGMVTGEATQLMLDIPPALPEILSASVLGESLNLRLLFTGNMYSSGIALTIEKKEGDIWRAVLYEKTMGAGGGVGEVELKINFPYGFGEFKIRLYSFINDKDYCFSVDSDGGKVYAEAVFENSSGLKLFSWDLKKEKGEAFNLTASEWLRFLDKINEVRQSLGYSEFAFSRAGIEAGERFYSGMYNEARSAIAQIPGAGTYIPIVYPGCPVTADTSSQDQAGNNINIIVDELNSVILKGW